MFATIVLAPSLLDASPRAGNGTLAPVTRRVPADFSTIQAAIDASSDGDTVDVSPGTWNGPIDYLGKNSLVRGLGGRDTTAIGGDGLHPGGTFANCENPAPGLRGFELRNGPRTRPVGRPWRCA